MQAHELLKQAIREHKQIRATYDGFYREMCPHKMGWKNGPRGKARRVLCFQFGGKSSHQLPPQGEWKCLEVDKLKGLTVVDGPWYSGRTHSFMAGDCIDEVEIEASR